MKKEFISLFVLILISYQILGQSTTEDTSAETPAIPTTQAEYEFMLDGDLDLGRQQEYSGTGKYNDYIGEYRFTSMDILKDLEYRYVGTVIIITDKKDKQEVICIPYLSKSLMKAHKGHLKQILRNSKLAKAYSEFIARRAAFVSAIGYHSP